MAPATNCKPILATVLLLVFIHSACARRNITINDSNPRFRYSLADVLPEATCRSRPGNEECHGKWWQEFNSADGTTFRGDVHNSFGPGTFVELTFQGSQLFYYGVTLDFGAHGFITLDGGSRVRISHQAGTRAVGSRLLWASPELNPAINHTLKVEFDDSTHGGEAGMRKWLGFDFVVVTVEDDSLQTGDGDLPDSEPTPTGSQLPGTPPTGGDNEQPQPTIMQPLQTQDTASTGTTDSRGGLSESATAWIAGGVTCAILLILIIPLALWVYRRRRRAVRIQSLPPPIAATRSPKAMSVADDYDYTPLPMATLQRDRRSPNRFENFDTRRYSAMYQSTAGSVGLPVDERPPAPSTVASAQFDLYPLPAPLVAAIHTPPLQPPRLPASPAPGSGFRLHNPDTGSRGTASHIGSP